ncbi:hypothetical protein ACFPK1_13095 [Actinomycetospora rhizophila]|uniref:Uncharacterized protein n=1 Tax=Actinomycetospora rhizophila TaxID=1416876 RepID=A0ABV9ZC44_9PSEU
MTTIDARTPAAPAPTAAPTAAPSRGAIRAAGLVLAACSLPWAVTSLVAGIDIGYPTHVVCAVFQLGIWALLLTMWRTGATGTSRVARAMLGVEATLLALASAASVLLLLGEPIASSTPTLVLDVFWPLSMLGMAVIGIKVALAGRWRGVLRAWPVVAETWVLVVLPSMALFGPAGASWACGLHLLLGYTTLGVLLAVRPDLTRR